MRRSIRPMLVTIICSLLVSCQRDLSNRVPSEEKTRFSGDGFTLSHPQTTSVIKEPPVYDFDIYRFLYQGRPILAAYVGNCPDFGYDGRVVSSKSKGVINGLPCARVQIMAGDEPVSTNVLIEFPNDRLWPRYMHLWYAFLPPDLRETAEDIIGSVKAREAGSVPIPPGVTISDSAEFPPRTPTWEQFEKRMQAMKQSLKAAQEAGEEIDPNVAGEIEQMEQILKRVKERGEY